MRKPTICLCENKDADQLRGNREADQRLCFRYLPLDVATIARASKSGTATCMPIIFYLPKLSKESKSLNTVLVVAAKQNVSGTVLDAVYIIYISEFNRDLKF